MSLIWSVIKQTFQEWMEDNIPQQGAALAFYTALSIAPLLVIALRIAAFFFGPEAAQRELENQMAALIGNEGSRALQEMIANAQKPAAGMKATALSIATLLIAASGVFGQLQESLNTIWGVASSAGNSWVQALRARFMSFTMVFGTGFMLIVSLIVSTVLATLSGELSDLPASWAWLMQSLHVLASIGVMTLLFSMMFKALPDVHVAWRDVWIGAVVTAVLFTIGNSAIGFYLGQSALASSYGVAGSFVVLLVWVYYSSQVLFLGAEFTQVLANRFGSRFAGVIPAAPRFPPES